MTIFYKVRWMVEDLYGPITLVKDGLKYKASVPTMAGKAWARGGTAKEAIQSLWISLHYDRSEAATYSYINRKFAELRQSWKKRKK